MAHLVIARKWRPQTFDEVVGQPHVVRILKNAIESNRIAHAYLFAGARGVGKTSVARIVAKTINCKDRIDSNPCNKCLSCTSITSGSSVDVLEIDAASNRGIDEIRELRESARYLPTVSNYKVYIIDEVHMLTGPAFNALLKTLEEPPGHVIFILATTAPHKIPITILSRCQRFDFRRISLSEISAHLKKIVEAEKVPLSDKVLSVIAREADGSMRDAQSLLEQVLTFVSGGGSDEEILELIGIVDQTLVQEAADAIMDRDIVRSVDIVTRAYGLGYNVERFCQELATYFRNLLLMKISKREAEKLIELPQSSLEELEERLDKASPETLHYYCYYLMKGINDLRFSSLPKLSLEMLLIQLCKVPDLRSVPDIIAKVKDIEARLLGYSGKLPPSEVKVPEKDIVSTTPVVSEQLQQPLAEADRPKETKTLDREHPKTWEGFLGFLRLRKKRFLADRLALGKVLAFTDEEIRLELNSGFNLIDESTKRAINDLASEFFGRNIRVTLVSRHKPEESKHQASRRKLNKLFREAKDSPAVNVILDILGGDIVNVRENKEGEGGLSLEENGID